MLHRAAHWAHWPCGTLLALDTLWRQVTDPTRRRPRLIVIDEAWLLMRQEQGARFVFRMAKSARKDYEPRRSSPGPAVVCRASAC